MKLVALVTLASACLAAMLIGARPDSASARPDAIACTLLSAPQLRSTLGLSQSTVLRNYDPTVPISEAVITECGLGVWSGAPPTSTAGMFALARSGHAAQVGIETWAPHEGHAKDWLATDYAKLTKRLRSESIAFPGIFSSTGLPAHTVQPPKLGYDGVGLTAAAPGLAKGLTVAIACWWKDTDHKAICVFDEEAAYRPVTAHLFQFAKAAVPAFLG